MYIQTLNEKNERSLIALPPNWEENIETSKSVHFTFLFNILDDEFSDDYNTFLILQISYDLTQDVLNRKPIAFIIAPLEGTLMDSQAFWQCSPISSLEIEELTNSIVPFISNNYFLSAEHLTHQKIITHFQLDDPKLDFRKIISPYRFMQYQEIMSGLVYESGETIMGNTSMGYQ